MSPFVIGVSSLHLFASGGDDGIRTHDPLLAGQVLSQLSYTPISHSLSETTSGLYSFFEDSPSKSNNDKISFSKTLNLVHLFLLGFSLRIPGLICSSRSELPAVLHRKEVIQPHLPIRLPCYDLTPIIEPTLGSYLTRLVY